VTKYQAAPCAINPDATPSPERLAKMQEQEKQRDDYWAGLKKAEAEKQRRKMKRGRNGNERPTFVN
jgi:hypothetical protein